MVWRRWGQWMRRCLLPCAPLSFDPRDDAKRTASPPCLNASCPSLHPQQIAAVAMIQVGQWFRLANANQPRILRAVKHRTARCASRQQPGGLSREVIALGLPHRLAVQHNEAAVVQLVHALRQRPVVATIVLVVAACKRQERGKLYCKWGQVVGCQCCLAPARALQPDSGHSPTALPHLKAGRRTGRCQPVPPPPWTPRLRPCHHSHLHRQQLVAQVAQLARLRGCAARQGMYSLHEPPLQRTAGWHPSIASCWRLLEHRPQRRLHAPCEERLLLLLR